MTYTECSIVRISTERRAFRKCLSLRSWQQPRCCCGTFHAKAMGEGESGDRMPKAGLVSYGALTVERSDRLARLDLEAPFPTVARRDDPSEVSAWHSSLLRQMHRFWPLSCISAVVMVFGSRGRIARSRRNMRAIRMGFGRWSFQGFELRHLKNEDLMLGVVRVKPLCPNAH
jgi:hypothetical protein